MFGYATESQITNAILDESIKKMKSHTKNDVIVIGGGPSGLMAARELAKKGVKVLIIERNNYLGGGFWIGGYLMNTITIRTPGEEILDELEIPYREYSKDLYVTNGPHACSKLIASTCDLGVKILNTTSFEDIVIRENNRVGGVVVNWTPVSSLPREITCVDPIALESKIVIDASGHDAVVVRRLEDRKLIKTPGFGGMWVEKSEDTVVEHTGEIHPGVIAVGMAVSTTYGLPRTGPTFSGVLISGRKGGEIAYNLLRNRKDEEELKQISL
ncbi:MAG: ribose 1,5-bisphosphate isomerase [Thermoplasmata archaeon]|nr:MAG: ribose 1,5-bisphosphate isomerase [Thermoplasmata archaeon]